MCDPFSICDARASLFSNHTSKFDPMCDPHNVRFILDMTSTVSDRLDELDPGRHAATTPAGTSQLGAKKPKQRKRTKKDGADDGKPKKGKGGDHPPPPDGATG